MIIRKDKLGLDATKKPTDLDIAWAAGIYEGEGSCIRAGHNRNSFAVSLAQKDPEFLYRLRDLFGGSVKEYPNNRGNIASSGKPFTIYAWRLCGDRGRMFLAAIYPFLTIRRKAQIDATSARRFLDMVGTAPRIDAGPSSVMEFLQQRIEQHVRTQRGLASHRRQQYQKEFYESRKADPAFMEQRRAQTRAWRAKRKEEKRINKVVAIA